MSLLHHRRAMPRALGAPALDGMIGGRTTIDRTPVARTTILHRVDRVLQAHMIHIVVSPCPQHIRRLPVRRMVEVAAAATTHHAVNRAAAVVDGVTVHRTEVVAVVALCNETYRRRAIQEIASYHQVTIHTLDMIRDRRRRRRTIRLLHPQLVLTRLRMHNNHRHPFHLQLHRLIESMIEVAAATTAAATATAAVGVTTADTIHNHHRRPRPT
jgi:hypothetical protein